MRYVYRSTNVNDWNCIEKGNSLVEKIYIIVIMHVKLLSHINHFQNANTTHIPCISRLQKQNVFFLIGSCCKQSRQASKNTYICTHKHESSQIYVHMHKEKFFNLTSGLHHIFGHTHNTKKIFVLRLM